MHVRYVSFDNSFDDSSATIGAQGPNRKQNFPVAYNTSGSVTNGMVVSYHFGPGSDPAVADTDGDGLLDSLEAIHGSDPRRIDTDSDGIPDKWEIDHGLNPSDAADATQDPDGDELNNLNEYLNDCNPNLPDTDGDGVDDGTEVRNGSNPNDDSDGGQMPPPEFFRTLTFNIYGDYAAWEMTVEGLGPDDTRIRRMSMGAPAASESEPMRMRKGNAYRISMRWLNSDGHNNPDWYCWQAQIDGKPTIHTYDWDSSIRNPGAEIIAGDGWIADNSSGLLTAHVHQQQGSGSNVAGGLIATLYVLDDPQLVPDLDRDGEIGASDVNLLANGRIFRFWTNDDHDAASTDGDVANDSGDDFPVNGRDWNTGRVNGRRDLIDFTPVWLDMSSTVTNLPPSIRNALTVRLRHPDGAMNAVWSSLDRHHANAFQTSVVGGFGPSLNGEARSAETVCIGASGVDLPPSFLQLTRAGGDQGVFLVEGRSATTAPLWVEVRCDNKVVCTNRLNTSISSVENMYRWRCLRSICGDASGLGSSTGIPANLPDNECDGKHFVFVHGYNVDVSSARGWAAEMFKRLWQSGSRSMFTAVDWYGNSSQFSTLFHGDVSPDYYANVIHAFKSAPSFATTCADLPGTNKTVLAHSLGNMLVSSAAKEHGLQYSRYYMLNAAVPMEAYDETEFSSNMVDSAWGGVPLNYRASDWNKLFQTNTNDFRFSLSWQGRFAGITNVVNCYSETEDVLANASAHDYGEVWAKQELFKGSAVWHALNEVPFLGLEVACEGGWGINTFYALNPAVYTPGYGFHSSVMDDISRADAIEHPLFTPFRAESESMHSTNLFMIADATYRVGLRAKFLADAIPATSFAVGANEASGVEENYNMQSPSVFGWPRRKDNRDLWFHSDLKDVAFYFVKPLFLKITGRPNNE